MKREKNHVGHVANNRCLRGERNHPKTSHRKRHWRDMVEGERQRQTQRERENSELYCTRITILGISIFLQSVPANINAKRLHIKQLNNREGRGREREGEGERERENSELYCTRITIWGISVFLQSVPANIHTKRLHIKQLNNREREGEREGGRERGRERERENSELYCTKIKILGTSVFLQSAPANLHVKRLHIKQLNNREGRERETGGERGGGRERELRTLLHRDQDFRHFCIFTICTC